MSNADITSGSVSPDETNDEPESPTGHDGSVDNDDPIPRVGHRRLLGRSLWFWGIGLVLVIGLLLGGLFIPTPYVILGPGSVRSAEDRVEILGGEFFTDDTDVLFTTVHIDDATPFGLIRGNLDDAMEITSRDEMFPQGRDETRQVNQHAMDFSKLVATREALLALGRDAEFAADGATVVGVVEGGPAEGVLAPGDTIVEVDGEAVALPSDLTEPLAQRVPGESVQVTVERTAVPDGESAATEAVETTTETVVLGASEEEEPRPILGVQIQPASPRIESSVEVEVDSGRVTGPSAGLAWSLAIVDRLTEESLTGDRDVAVTGEILDGGRVGAIGGVTQKVATVKRNGVDVLLYPASTSAAELAEMERIAGGEVELVPVATLAEALEYLDPSGSVLRGAA